MENTVYLHWDYFLFFQGLGFIILAAACLVLVWNKHRELPWIPLGTFAALYGLGNFFSLLWPFEDHLINNLYSSFAASSFIFLAEFARRGNRLPGGKPPGFWIMIPLFAAALLGGYYGGLGALEQFSRYTFGIVGSLGGALALLRQTPSLPIRNKVYFTLASLALLLCCLGLVLARVPADILAGQYDQPSAFIFGLPHPLVMGLLALAMAFGLSLHDIDNITLPVRSDYFVKRSFIHLFLSIMTMLIIVIGGWFVINYLGEHALNDLKKRTRATSHALADHFAFIKRQTDQVAAYLAIVEPAVVSLLAGEQATTIQGVQKILEKARSLYEVDDLSIVDRHGKPLVSTSGSFAQPDMRSEPYQSLMMGALSGVPSCTIFYDFSSAVPYYYSAFPIRNFHGTAMGAVIIKKGLLKYELSLKRYRYAFLVNTEGVILLTSESSLRLINLWPQYKSEDLPKSLSSVIDPRKTLLPYQPKGELIPFQGRLFLATYSMIGYEGFHIYSLESMDTVLWIRFLVIAIMVVLSLLTLTFFLGYRRLLFSTLRELASESRFQVIFQNVPKPIFILNRLTSGIMAANRFAYQWLGYTREELLRLKFSDIAVNDAGKNTEYRKKDGTLVDIEETMTPIALDGEDHLLVIAHDLTEINKASKEIKLAKEFSESIIKTAQVLIIGLDLQGKIVLFNDYAEKVTGWSRDEAIGLDWLSHFVAEEIRQELIEVFKRLVKGYAPVQHENPIITKTRQEKIIAWNNTVLEDSNGKIYLILATGVDVTERKRNEELMKHLSLFDGLTGIANRRSFDEFFSREWRRAIREETPLSLIMADIDFFKNYNDTEGHQKGDACLKQVAQAMAETLKRPMDLAARYGGEEFAIVLPDTDPEGALLIAHALRKNVAGLAIPHPKSSAGPMVTISLGVATAYPSLQSSSEELIVAADRALYQAKQTGRNKVVADEPGKVRNDHP